MAQWQPLASGPIRKMRSELGETVQYSLPIGDESIPMNELLGKHLNIEFLGKISCTHCGRSTKKSFSQGYCYPCFTKLAACDTCIVSPEKCHFAAGTCREPEWAEQHCMTDHIVYLANSSGLKVGITRATQIPTRWIDQGAVQAMPFARVSQRLYAGLLEDAMKEFLADKTNWRAMLKGDVALVDMAAAARQLRDQTAEIVADLQAQYGLQAVSYIDAADPVSINYPVALHPTKVSSFNLDKNPNIEGKLNGIKGQYLIFDTGVVNLRKYTAYHLSIACSDS